MEVPPQNKALTQQHPKRRSLDPSKHLGREEKDDHRPAGRSTSTKEFFLGCQTWQNHLTKYLEPTAVRRCFARTAAQPRSDWHMTWPLIAHDDVVEVVSGREGQGHLRIAHGKHLLPPRPRPRTRLLLILLLLLLLLLLLTTVLVHTASVQCGQRNPQDSTEGGHQTLLPQEDLSRSGHSIDPDVCRPPDGRRHQKRHEKRIHERGISRVLLRSWRTTLLSKKLKKKKKTSTS